MLGFEIEMLIFSRDFEAFEVRGQGTTTTTIIRGLVDRGGGKSVIPALQSFSLGARS